MNNKHQWDHKKLHRLERAHGQCHFENLLKFLMVIILGRSLGMPADKVA